MRNEEVIPAKVLARCSFHGIRGPLSRAQLNLPLDTALGDPALLLPIFHEVTRSDLTAGRTICVPHFNDTKSEEDLLALSGADIVVRAAVANDIGALCTAIDHIASASFVLAGSLHAAIIACAYDVPFGFWDNQFLDIPF